MAVPNFLSPTVFEVQFLHSPTLDIIKHPTVDNQVGMSLF